MASSDEDAEAPQYLECITDGYRLAPPGKHIVPVTSRTIVPSEDRDKDCDKAVTEFDAWFEPLHSDCRLLQDNQGRKKVMERMKVDSYQQRV